MLSSSCTFSTPSTNTVTIFSCKFTKKKDNSNICIALLATDKTIKQSKIHNKQQKINQKQITLKLPSLEIQSPKK
jgi:hypothetical protein